MPDETPEKSDFAAQAQQERSGLVSEFVDFLREKSPFYVYSNPITPAEAAAASRALAIVDSEAGRLRIAALRSTTRRFQEELVGLGYETIPGEHPVVPLLVRDTPRTAALVLVIRDGNDPVDPVQPVQLTLDERVRRIQPLLEHDPAVAADQPGDAFKGLPQVRRGLI